MIPQWKYRRAAPRAQDVLARLIKRASRFAAYQATVGTSAADVIQHYDDVRALEARRRTSMEARAAMNAALVLSLRSWAGLVSISIPTQVRGEFGNNPEVPDDVISDVVQLLAVVDKHEMATGQPLPFSAAMREELAADLLAAKTEWADHIDLVATLANARTELKLACARFNRDLVVFRAAIANYLGRKHPDYQLLRLAQIKRERNEAGEADEADEAEVAESEATEPVNAEASAAE